MKILTSLLLTLITLTAAGQEATRLRAPQRVSSEYVSMSYCSDNIQYSVALQNGAPTKAAIAITRGMLGSYADAEIVGVRVGLAAAATNVSGWLVEGNDPSRSISESSPTYANKDQGWTDLIFRSPYKFTASQGSNAAIIVGYTSTGENQVGFDGEAQVFDNGNFMWTSTRGGWGSVANACRQNGYGNCCIQILLGGVELPSADMGISRITTKHAEQGQPVVLRGIVENNVPTPVTAFTLRYTINGTVSGEKRMTQNVNTDSPAEFTLELPPFTTTGQQTVTVEITDVNGEADANPADNTMTATIESIEAGCYFPQVHVVEESTNLACGFCPRGIVVMESMEQRHPDRFIGIAVHSDVTSATDPMFIPAYYNRLATYIADPVSMSISEPKGIMNRNETLCGDPLYWDSYFDNHADDLSEAGLWINAVSRADGGKIEVNTTARFRHNHDSHPYRIAFVLVENSVTGYMQSNYYAGGNYGTMNGWENLGNPCRIALNNVARGIWQFAGLEQSLPAQLEKGTSYPFAYTLSLDGCDIQKADNLSVVALMLDGKTEQIIQAHRMPVGSTSGISQTTSSRYTSSTRYDLQGRTIRNAQKGLYIQNGKKLLGK